MELSAICYYYHKTAQFIWDLSSKLYFKCNQPKVSHRNCQIHNKNGLLWESICSSFSSSAIKLKLKFYWVSEVFVSGIFQDLIFAEKCIQSFPNEICSISKGTQKILKTVNKKHKKDSDRSRNKTKPHTLFILIYFTANYFLPKH